MRVILLWLLVISTPVLAETASQDLAELLRHVDTFSAKFKQTLISAKGQTLQQIDGNLKAKRPGLFYWYTSPPLEQEIVTDGEQVWLYDPDLEQVTVQRLSVQLSKTPALLLSGEVSDIEEQYSVTKVTNELHKAAYVLHPKSPDSLFDSLYLAFDHRKQLNLMQLRDSLGQETTLEFSRQIINQGITDEDFHFEIPEGVDVIRQ